MKTALPFDDRIITLAHGNGGEQMSRLIDSLFIEAFSNAQLLEKDDQARLPLSDFNKLGDTLAFSTDSYVIDPLFFPGGDIGKLAVCGTVNDLAVGGATPCYLSCAFIIEEGLLVSTLQEIIHSMAKTARQAKVEIVTGDTKVVPKGAVDKLFINTSGIGVIPAHINWKMARICEGDHIIVSGTIGDHGATILNLRENLGLLGDLRSDCAVLAPMLATLRHISGVKAVRDATRGGVNAILHEYSQATQQGVLIEESQLPLKNEIRGMCELLGLEPLNFANEGKVIIVVDPNHSEQTLNTLRQHPLGQHATIIGQFTALKGVKMRGIYGITRQLDLPNYEPLPRIC